MNCCAKCFGDTFLENVIKQNANTLGKCNFCKTLKVLVINPEKLNDYFQPLLSLYETSDTEGESIAILLKHDWMLFPNLSDETTIELLESILESKLQNSFIPNKNTNKQKILNWQEFKKELKHDNRYFPKKAPKYEHIKGLFEHLISKNIPECLYRSRINKNNNKIPLSEMGKPPSIKSMAGRANPTGIPYLYTASNIETAIIETRPHKGDTLTIATFKIKSTLRLADLRNPRKSISPFSLLDEDMLNQIFTDLDYLCHLGEELSKPILPREANLEYLSSQYLCELIKHCGFDGVIYESSVGNGDNYAIFSDEKLEAISSNMYSVNNITISSSHLQSIK